MDDERHHFIEEFGTMFEEMGGGRMVGRVLGFLMVADPPAQSAEEIAAALHSSRGAISQATRILVQIGLIRRFRQPRERRDSFQVRRDGWTEGIRRRDREIDRLQAMFEQAKRITAGGDPRDYQHLDESIALMRFWKSGIADLARAWEVERERQFGDPSNRHA